MNELPQPWVPTTLSFQSSVIPGPSPPSAHTHTLTLATLSCPLCLSFPESTERAVRDIPSQSLCKRQPAVTHQMLLLLSE